MRKPMPLFFMLLAVAALTTACGGASNDDYELAAPPPATPSGAVPPGATASIQAFVAFLGGLMSSERDLPLNIDAAVPPTSETAAPLPVAD